MSQTLRFLFIGDVMGAPGMTMFQRWVPKLKEQYKIDAVIVNGENANKNGKGISLKNIEFFKHNGASIITTGNHVWEQSEVYTALDERTDIVRPANYPPGCPGKGYALFEVNGYTVAVINLIGRVFSRDLLDCPFRTIESLLTFIQTRTNIIFVDFHADATSEKSVLAYFVDGKVSGVFGTHTHVQTADEQILPGGTSFITDIGSCGALYSGIGMKHDQLLRRFLYHQRSGKLIVETKGPLVLSGVLIEVDAQTGRSLHIERIRVIDEELQTTGALAE